MRLAVVLTIAFALVNIQLAHADSVASRDPVSRLQKIAADYSLQRTSLQRTSLVSTRSDFSVLPANEYAPGRTEITRIGFSMYSKDSLSADSAKDREQLEFRAGISRASAKAVAGVELIVNW